MTDGAPRRLGRFLIVLCLAAPLAAHGAQAPAAPNAIANPILFVTQVPTPDDFTAVASTFGSHVPTAAQAPRGGDLWIRYPDGTLKNLTAGAGLGNAGFQGAGAIAVREPSVHWSGTKALFSMAVGAPAQQYLWETYTWQIYEITGLGPTDQPVITRVPNQPAGYNNVSPFYGTDERVLFTSDRPRDGQAHLYPQLDEYEEAPTTTGIWSLDPVSGDLRLLNHTVSGAFSPSIDSAGRVIFTRWDHLQRDQQADADFLSGAGDSGPGTYGTFNFADESAGAAHLATRAEVYPEPRSARTDLLAGTNLQGHSLNLFFPWQVNEDGTEEETLNHIGRHELESYFDRVFNDDPALTEFISASSGRFNPNVVENVLEIAEDPNVPGRFFAVDAPEFYTHGAGQVIAIAPGGPGIPANQMAVAYYTDRSTAGFVPEGQPVPPQNSGHYRNPLPLTDGTLVAAHTAEARADANTGTRALPGSRYDFRLKTLKQVAGVWVPDQPLTAGISKTISYFDPDVLVSYSGPLWELYPVEVRARTKPPRRSAVLPAPEQSIFDAEGVNVGALRMYLRQHDLALIVSRNVTTRDEADRQQPYNLKIAGSSTQTTGGPGKLYEIAHLQLFQADQIRGLNRPGRRVLAQVLHEPEVKNPPNPGGPAGSVALGSDGSMAAFVPAHRATTWQITDAAGTPVIRERFWLTFQPGEIRSCTSCHGINSASQAGQPAPANPPAALGAALRFWKALPEGGGGLTRFYTLPPCRLVDTRNTSGALGGPALQASAPRLFPVAGQCGVPSTARSISGNVTVVQPAADGDLRLFPGDAAAPAASTINFRAGRIRANNAVLLLARDGSGTLGVQNDAPGTVDFVLDVNGYFQ